jgi:hypothetical protein
VMFGVEAIETRQDPRLRLAVALPSLVIYVAFPEQWDPKSPWHDRRVRLAAAQAVDKQAVNEAERLGFGRLTGSIVHRIFDFALPLEPHPHNLETAKRLLAEAGCAKGFDAGELTPVPALHTMGESVVDYLGVVGIKAKVRLMERATFFSAWHEKKLRGLILGVAAMQGNAATVLETVAVRGGYYADGSYPDIDELFRQQATERDRQKRQALLHEIQRRLAEGSQMNIGIGLPAQFPDAAPDSVLEWARKADRGPFSCLSLIDRLVYPNYEPLIALTAAAAVTQRVGLMTSVLLVTLRNTGLLAKEVATLDVISKGRLTLGIGAGGRVDDFRAAPAPFGGRGKRLEEQIALLRRIWSGQPVADDVGPIGPRPVQAGGPPLLIGGFAPVVLRRAGRLADGYVIPFPDANDALAISAEGVFTDISGLICTMVKENWYKWRRRRRHGPMPV